MSEMLKYKQEHASQSMKYGYAYDHTKWYEQYTKSKVCYKL